MTEDEAAPSGPYAGYKVRQGDWFSSGMALQCGGKAGGSDDGHIVGMIQDGDSVATLMRARQLAGRPHFKPLGARRAGYRDSSRRRQIQR
jgi:hypothetical protein